MRIPLSNFPTRTTHIPLLWLLTLALAFLPCLIAVAVAPTVTGVRFSNSPPDGQHNFYTVDDEIEVEVTFSETVTVSGRPRLTLIFDDDSSVRDEVYATYDGGSGTATLTFTYRVDEGEKDHDGVEIKANSLESQGGTIQNRQDPPENAVLTHNAVAEDSNRKVDTLATSLVIGHERVPASPILFNEIGNSTRTGHDWIELLNTTNRTRNVEDWELSIITDDQDDESIVKLPDEEIPANGTLLIVNSDPGSTPLAAGIEFGSTDTGYGATHLYLVADELALPNDGRFLLILRDEDRDTGTLDSIVDVAGNHFADTSSVPLDAGNVWVRDERRDGYEKNAWEEAEYTGLGYDRGADDSVSNGGTPGYDNEAIKDRISEFDSQAQITISEIMLATGSRRVPQWIELYNSSLTEAVNLNGWHLEIENYNSSGDFPASRYAKITFQNDLYILPNQTVLIVSNSARTAEKDAFPSEARVYNLYDEHRDDLDIESRWDAVLSDEGFYLALADRRSPNKPVDEVGNLDGKRQTVDKPAWTLPAGITKDETRASIIRRYGDTRNSGRTEARDGTKRNAWISAANVKLIGDTYYGDTTDLGNPGFRDGGPLPVQLSSFQVERTETGIVIKWTTESELNNAGFNVLRREAKSGEFKPLNTMLIAGAGTTGERNTYQFVDTTAKTGIVYYYQLEDVSFAGERQTLATHRPRGQLSAYGKLTTTWGSLKRKN